jgi:hypothetical protein
MAARQHQCRVDRHLTQCDSPTIFELGLVHYNNEGRYPMFGLIMLLAVLAFSAVAVGFGVDSRDGSTDERAPVSPIGLR